MKFHLIVGLLISYINTCGAYYNASSLDNRKELLVPKEIINAFKAKHNLKENIELDLQLINKETNTITLNGKEFSLDGVEPVTYFTPNATYMHNGEYMPMPDDSRLPHVTLGANNKKTGDAIFVRKNVNDGEVKSISIIEGHDGSYHSLDSIVPGVLVTLKAEYYKNRKGNRLLHSQKSSSGEGINFFRRRLQSCTEYRVIEVALAYDSTFCAEYGPAQAAADQEAKDILAEASALYEAQGICTKLALSHLEGYCNVNNDPFATLITDSGDIGCPTSPSIQTDLGLWVNNNKAGVTKDTFHMMFFKNLNQDKYGCANQDKMCVPNGNAHGVENMFFTQKQVVGSRGAVLAREIGRNLNADFINAADFPQVAGQTYIMDQAGVGNGNHVWSQPNLDILKAKIPSLDCLTVEAATDTSTVGQITTAISNLFGGGSPPEEVPPEIAAITAGSDGNVTIPSLSGDNYNELYNIGGKVQLKSSSNNMCLNVPQSNTAGNPVLRMIRCNGRDNQKWEMDSLGHIHSALDYNKCIGLPGPSTRPRTVPGTALQLYDCVSNDITQLWHWNANGRKIKSQWRTKRCLTAAAWGGGKVTVTQCARNDAMQWFYQE